MKHSKKQPKTKPAGKARKSPKSAPADVAPKAEKTQRSRERDPRLPAAGTVLTRKYKDKEFRVTVLEEEVIAREERAGNLHRHLGGAPRGAALLFHQAAARRQEGARHADAGHLLGRRRVLRRHLRDGDQLVREGRVALRHALQRHVAGVDTVDL